MSELLFVEVALYLPTRFEKPTYHEMYNNCRTMNAREDRSRRVVNNTTILYYSTFFVDTSICRGDIREALTQQRNCCGRLEAMHLHSKVVQQAPLHRRCVARWKHTMNLVSERPRQQEWMALLHLLFRNVAYSLNMYSRARSVVQSFTRTIELHKLIL